MSFVLWGKLINIVDNLGLNIVISDCYFLSNGSFFKCYFKNPCFQLPEDQPWTDSMMCMISASTGINGESLAHHL